MALPVQLILILPLLARSTVALTDPRLPNIFYPFGTDVGDRVSPPADEDTDGPYNITDGFISVSYTHLTLPTIYSV